MLLLVGLAVAAAGCDAGGSAATTTIPASSLVAESPDPTTSATSASTVTTTEPSPPLVAAGCGLFDPDELGALTGLGVPPALVQSESSANALVCSYVGTDGATDANVRVDLQPLDSKAPGHWTTPGELESEIAVGSVRGVGTGRGSLRAALPGLGGLTLTVNLRRLSAEAPVLRDRDHLDVRDAVAAYVVEQLR